jgi:zinc/manganese transport system permease protein
MDSTLLTFLAAPLAASLVLAGLFAYLGLHVVERGVIFVDLSLAQIASLGSTVALLLPALGNDPHGATAYWMGLAFTFVGAVIFATVRGQSVNVPQEAIIGIGYAVASAAAIVALSKSTSGGEHLKDMLVGNITAVSWHEVAVLASLCVAVGGLHYAFRRKFLLISTEPARAAAEGVSLRLWDFIFYISFGVVVSSAVAVAGVLLVFCYLIVPSVGGMLWATRIGSRLAVGWVMGVLASMLGMFFSVKFDLPTGAAIVCTFGLLLVVMAVARPLIVRRA